jgi:hypothetical protein
MGNLDNVTTTSTQSWDDVFKNGLSTLLDGYVKKELIKNTKTEQIPPTPTQQPFEQTAVINGVANQNNVNADNYVIMGVPMNKTLIQGTALLLVGIFAYRAVS